MTMSRAAFARGCRLAGAQTPLRNLYELHRQLDKQHSNAWREGADRLSLSAFQSWAGFATPRWDWAERAAATLARALFDATGATSVAEVTAELQAAAAAVDGGPASHAAVAARAQLPLSAETFRPALCRLLLGGGSRVVAKKEGHGTGGPRW